MVTREVARQATGPTFKVHRSPQPRPRWDTPKRWRGDSDRPDRASGGSGLHGPGLFGSVPGLHRGAAGSQADEHALSMLSFVRGDRMTLPPSFKNTITDEADMSESEIRAMVHALAIETLTLASQSMPFQRRAERVCGTNNVQRWVSQAPTFRWGLVDSVAPRNGSCSPSLT